MLTHLSVQDIYNYLLGEPASSRLADIEGHCRICAECLEQMCAMAANIDQTQLENRSSPFLITLPSAKEPLLAKSWQPFIQNHGWALNAVAASLMLLAVPDSARFVQLDRLFDSPLQSHALHLSSTRQLPEDLMLVTAPKVELATSRNRTERRFTRYPLRQFQAPQLAAGAQFVEVAMLDTTPDLNVEDNAAEPLLLDFEPPQIEGYRAKPGIFRRLFSAVASPFRSPRS